MSAGASQDRVCGNDESQRQLDELALQQRMAQIRHKILVLSGKGGVGKSTVAANLAAALALSGQRVGLLDVDLHGPSITTILGLKDRRLECDDTGAIAPLRVGENLSVVSIGLLLDRATEAVIWRGPMKYNVIRQFLKDVQWGPLDYLVIDSPPGTGDEPLAVAQMIGSGAQAVIVTTPQEVAVADVRRSVSFCRSLGLPVAGIIENMSTLTCPHCRRPIEVFGTGGGLRLARETGAAFLGQIPFDPEIAASGDSGRPFVDSSADSPAATAFALAIQSILNPQHAAAGENNGGGKERKPMKIAVPMAQGRLCMHFGHCEQFALVEVDKATKTVTGTEYLAPPEHEPGVLPRWLHEQGAEVIIAGGMGRRAQDLFAQNGIQVVVGAPSAPIDELVAAYLSGSLESGPNACDH